MKWIDLYEQNASYISDEFSISSAFEAYVYDLNYIYETNDGAIDIFVRISYDGNTWTEWTKINDSAYEPLFRDDFYNLESCSFQYKAELLNNGETSPTFSSFSYSLTGSYIVDNVGDLACRPELWIKKKNGSGTISLTNKANNQTLILTDLNDDEEVYVDCDNEDIMTNLPLTYRYSNHNDVFLELEVGENVLSGEGDFELSMRYEFKTLQG